MFRKKKGCVAEKAKKVSITRPSFGWTVVFGGFFGVATYWGGFYFLPLRPLFKGTTQKLFFWIFFMGKGVVGRGSSGGEGGELKSYGGGSFRRMLR